jgi:dTDP-3-amino-3,4,6-trideoxy-alpha-D-glucose transaminase
VIPLVDLAAQHAPLRPEIDAAIARVVSSGRFVSGPEVEAFESEFAAFCGAKYAVSCASGTDAIELIGRAWRERASLERGAAHVVIPANTFVATQRGLERAGLGVVHADCDLATGAMSPDAVASAFAWCDGTRRSVAAVMPVWLFGHVPTYFDIQARTKNRAVFWDDACQAHGCKPIGTMSAWSFYPSKPLGALGDGGCVTTDDAELAGIMRQLRDHGRDARGEHVRAGWTSRLDAIQAAVLRVKLPHVLEWNSRRRRLAEWYHASLQPLSSEFVVSLPEPPNGAMHLYVVRVDATVRDRVREHMRELGVQTGVHYATPLTSPAVAPNAWQRAREMISLPMFAEMTSGMVDEVAYALARAVRA